MTTAPPSWVPGEACTLPTAEQPLRAAEFDDVFRAALTGVCWEGPTRVRLTLTGPSWLADRVQDLADRETGCCSFFEFIVTPEPGGVLLAVTVPEARTAVLSALVARAEGMSPAPRADGPAVRRGAAG